MAHKSVDELVNKIEKAKSQVIIDGTYVHYKAPDKPYKVLAIGLQEATEKSCVSYQAQYGEKLTWVRNLDGWLTKVTNENGEIVQRFLAA